MSEQPLPGSVQWRDLTVQNADALQQFYHEVVGWQVDTASQGDYDDYVVSDAEGEPVGGICHARGPNADLPPQWLIYITVENMENSIERCLALGGKIVSPQRDMGGYGTVCVIQDPAGAVAALIQPPSTNA